MKYLLPILLCVCLSGCAFLKDTLGGQANVAEGFTLTSECFFTYPVAAAVVGFRFVKAGAPDTCGQVMMTIDKAASMSRVELLEYLFAQYLAGMFTPCATDAKVQSMKKADDAAKEEIRAVLKEAHEVP